MAELPSHRRHPLGPFGPLSTLPPIGTLQGMQVSRSVPETVVSQRKTVELAGVQFDYMSEQQVIEKVLGEMSGGRGGQIITPNVDILHRVVRNPELRGH